MAPKKNIQLSSTRGRRKGKKTPSSSSSKAADPYVDIPADTGLPDTPVATLATPATHVATLATLGDVLERTRSPTPPRERSRESSVSSCVSAAVSALPAWLMTRGRRRRKGPRRVPATSASPMRS